MSLFGTGGTEAAELPELDGAAYSYKCSTLCLLAEEEQFIDKRQLKDRHPDLFRELKVNEFQFKLKVSKVLSFFCSPEMHAAI